jgi:TonB family protein
MLPLGRTFAFALLCLPLVSTADSPNSTPDLKGKILYLRGMYVENDLAFDAQGNPTGKVTPGPFFISMIKIEKAKLSHGTLKLDGHRVVLVRTDAAASTPASFQSVVTPTEVRIQVAGEEAHPENWQPLLAKIFANSPEDALADNTPQQQQARLDALPTLGPAPSAVLATSPAPSSPGSSRPPNLVELPDAHKLTPLPPPKQGQYAVEVPNNAARVDVSRPHLLYSVPTFCPEGSGTKPALGIAVVSLIVDVAGFPSHVQISRSPGPGLDAAALATVSQYRFAPATRQNNPVPVEINIELVFRGC